jgi:hypothetical protein
MDEWLIAVAAWRGLGRVAQVLRHHHHRLAGTRPDLADHDAVEGRALLQIEVDQAALRSCKSSPTGKSRKEQKITSTSHFLRYFPRRFCPVSPAGSDSTACEFYKK